MSSTRQACAVVVSLIPNGVPLVGDHFTDATGNRRAGNTSLTRCTHSAESFRAEFTSVEAGYASISPAAIDAKSA